MGHSFYYTDRIDNSRANFNLNLLQRFAWKLTLFIIEKKKLFELTVKVNKYKEYIFKALNA